MSTTEPQPSPPLSDLCLLAVLGEMNLKNRLAALKVCPRWFHRVREVNQAVRSIAIAVQARRGVGEEDEDEDDGCWKSELLDGHRGAIESEPSVKLLKKVDGSPLYPPKPPITAADCLLFDELSDITTAQQIIAALPRVTQLVFLGSSYGEEYQHLVTMLQNPVWRHQLTRLRLIDRSSSGCQQERRLFTAINGLTSLRQLTLDLVIGDFALLDLSALGQLETVHIDCLQGLRSFLACLRKYGAASGGNALRGGLPRVELVNVGRDYLKELRELSLPLRRLIARLVEDEPVIIRPRRSIASVLTTYPALSSLELDIPPWQVHQVFADLASLGGSGGGGLFHLRLEVNFCNCSEEEDRRPFLPPPVAALSSVKALDLDLAVASHADLEWLNLPVTMPALEAIYLPYLYCSECKKKWNQSSTTDQCLRAVYEILQRTGLPPSQIAFNRGGKVCTMEELLNKDEPSS